MSSQRNREIEINVSAIVRRSLAIFKLLRDWLLHGCASFSFFQMLRLLFVVSRR